MRSLNPETDATERSDTRFFLETGWQLDAKSADTILETGRDAHQKVLWLTCM